MAIENQAIQLAKRLSSEFADESGFGLLGLSIRPRPVTTAVENMIAQGDISKSQELFTARLGFWGDASEPDQGESFYTFGFINQTTVQASGQQIKYAPIDSSQSFWMFRCATAIIME